MRCLTDRKKPFLQIYIRLIYTKLNVIFHFAKKISIFLLIKIPLMPLLPVNFPVWANSIEKKSVLLYIRTTRAQT